MDPNFAATVAYTCPRCGIGLETAATAWPGWLRCPGCGRGSLPPFPSARPSPKRVPIKVSYDPDILVIEDEDAVMVDPRTPWFGSTRDSDQPQTEASSPPALLSSETKRTVLTVILCLCLSLFLVTLLIGESFTAGIFGMAAGLILLFLVRPGPPRKRP